jgi:uncharacterized membrane protein YqaE (UPF0057 family)
MLSERKKMVATLTPLVLAVSIEILSILFQLYLKSNFADFLFNIGLTRWGWAPASVFAIIAIAGTLYLKPGNWVLRVFMILVSVAAFLFSSYWALGLYVITHLKP